MSELLHDLRLLVAGIPATLLISAAAFAIGAIAGLPLALARRARSLLTRTIAISFIDTFRALPPIVFLFLLFYGLAGKVVTLAPFEAAVIGLGVISAAYMAEIYRSALLSVRRGQWEAADALGFNRTRTLATIIAPQAARIVVPSSATWAIGLLKETSIVSIIGVQDVTFRASSATQGSASPLVVFVTAGVIYIALSLPFAVVGRWTNAQLRRVVLI